MYNAYIVEISQLRKHTNADRLMVATIFGDPVIVDLSYSVGDVCVYFPEGVQLSQEFAEKHNLLRHKDENGKNVGYLDPNKRLVKMIKLRGERSEGLLMKIDALSDYVDVDTLKVGETFTTLGGVEICRKYIPRGKHNPNAKRDLNKARVSLRVKYPNFFEHKDIDQLRFMSDNDFVEGELITISDKYHGTSGRTSHTKKVEIKHRGRLAHALGFKDKIEESWEVVSGTRRTVLSNYDGGYYGNDQFRKVWHDKIAAVLPKNYVLYYELVGYTTDGRPIMSKCPAKLIKEDEFHKIYGDDDVVFDYGCAAGECKMYVYRVAIISDEGIEQDLPTEQAKKFCERLGFEFVEVLERFFFTSYADLVERCEKYLDTPEPLSGGKHIREGVVVRLEDRATYKAYKHKGYWFKLLNHIITENATEADMEDEEALIKEGE